jgi:hypothetical protein
MEARLPHCYFVLYGFANAFKGIRNPWLQNDLLHNEACASSSVHEWLSSSSVDGEQRHIRLALPPYFDEKFETLY